MMRSLFSGVSGLKSHQTRMDVIGNNIANVNTIGFKSSRVTFADTLYQTQTGASAPTGTVGGTNPKQIGLGVGVASIDLLFTDASTQATGKNTDLALSGNGLFVVSTDAAGKDKYYTRAGAFSFDANYNYVVPGSGHHVVGWNADENGNIDTKSTPEGIRIKDAMRSMGAKATTTVTYKGNMNSSVPTITKIVDQAGNDLQIAVVGDTSATGDFKTQPKYPNPYPADPAKAGTPLQATESLTLTMSDGTTRTITAKSSYQYRVGCSMPITTIANVYDSLGNLHKVPFLFTKVPGDTTTNPPLKYDQWEVALSPSQDSGGKIDDFGTSTIKEDDGSFTSVTMGVKKLEFDQYGKYKTGLGSPELTLTNGAGSGPSGTGALPTMKVAVNLTSLTQYSGSDTIKADYDGNTAGTLKEINTDQSGILTGTYTNGEKRSLAQVAVAQFDNAQGLTKKGANLYTESNNSGTPNIKTVSALGLTLTPSALEMSNVDVANEFADMVVTQRGFQSNSKIITVGDEMLETVINMKR
ncbi:flagellar hook protein FlgE [Selenomonas sputigena]|uniref:flagellar hook protein FlgE n=1 Tax=Selenomonas sputigena TaxID=69823 RepID=UPI0022323132|nr:flagellar hook protein FlgE [Selenomonas sputigena]UZD43170.1 flagellar hook protein FlgE [Selenomonas sputigena]